MLLSRRVAAARTIATTRHNLSRPKRIHYDATKIVATIGPASEDAHTLPSCVAAGLNVMRVNFSHATVDEFHLRRTNLRAADHGNLVPVMLDTKGPEIRMGGLRICRETKNRKAKIELVQGATVRLTTEVAADGDSDEKRLFVNFPQLAQKLNPLDRVLLDDGLVSLRVVEIDPSGDVVCEVLNTSAIGERKGVNLPGVVTGLPALSEKDKEDIRFGIEHDIDMVAASFVRSAEGVRQIRDYIGVCHTLYADKATPPPLVISKIETTEALDNLEEIVEASDGIMVARGDLGVEVPLETVATLQKTMVNLCAAHGKPVIVATQMLDTMQSNPRPTRAEVADVTNAVMDGADAVMLSGESANGKYPVESIEMQRAIARHVEEHIKPAGPMMRGRFRDDSLVAVLESAPRMALETPGVSEAVEALYATGERVLTVAGADGGVALARALAALRLDVPILFHSTSLKACRQLNLWRGVKPVHADSVGELPAEVQGCELAGGAFSIRPLDSVAGELTLRVVARSPRN